MFIFPAHSSSSDFVRMPTLLIPMLFFFLMEIAVSLQMIEFFSGIGGMRYGVEQAVGRVEECHAYEISLHCNEVYRLNHDSEKVRSSVTTKLIEQLHSVPDAADLWTMSPPCQPFTKKPNSKHLDIDDNRCAGFKHISNHLLPKHRPKWILLENVKGFASSRMLEAWKESLRDNGYTWQEYMLSPTMFGIPNHRTRYYMICERSNRWPIEQNTRNENMNETLQLLLDGTALWKESSSKQPPSTILQLSEFLESDQNVSSFQVPSAVFEKPFARHCLHFALPTDTISHCFTGSYGSFYHEASGSLLAMDKIWNERDNVDFVEHYKNHPVRRFSPKEICNLMCFPNDFQFPETMDLDHQYKLIGNAVNVKVTAAVAKELLKS